MIPTACLANLFISKAMLYHEKNEVLAIRTMGEKLAVDPATGEFDARFYLRAYPIVQRELAQGLAASPEEHYQKYGMRRGYLSSPDSPRYFDGNDKPSAFGGLWPDAYSAESTLQQRRDAGEINEEQAQLLQAWMRDGYVVLKQGVDEALIDAAAADLDKAYAGGFRKALFECHELDEDANIHWRAEVNQHAAKVLDLHHFSQAARDIMFAPSIIEFLALIFESETFATQSLGFLRGSGQEGHQDSAYVPFTLPRNFAATWIALEDVTIGAGELFYYAGSHRFPDFLYGGKYKSIAEAERLGYNVEREEVERHVSGLRNRAKEQKAGKTVFAARKGDVLVWHADLVHGGNPVSAATTRKSFVTHYCPSRLSPLFSERMAIDLFEQDGHFMTSHLYAKSDFAGLGSPGLFNRLFKNYFK